MTRLQRALSHLFIRVAKGSHTKTVTFPSPEREAQVDPTEHSKPSGDTNTRVDHMPSSSPAHPQFLVALSVGAGSYRQQLQEALGSDFLVVAEMRDQLPDVLILTLSEPDLEATMRRYGRSSWIFVISPLPAESNRAAQVLEMGADNYLNDVAPDAVAAHVRAMVRRRKSRP